MATTNDIKNGSVLNIDGQLWNVVEFQQVKPGQADKMREYVEARNVEPQDGQPVVSKVVKTGVVCIRQERICTFVAHVLVVGRL